MNNIKIKSRIIYTGSTELNNYIYTGDLSNVSDKPNLSNPIQLSNLYHYDSSNKIVFTDCSEDVSAQFALFFKNQNLIKVPAKTVAVLNKYLSKDKWYQIHPDKETAIELCLLLLSNLTDTFFNMRDSEDSYEKKGWKRLKAQILNEQLTGSKFESDTRKNIIAALTAGTSKGVIVECDQDYKKGQYSFSYRLGPAYLGKGVETYEVKSKHVQQLLNKAYFKAISESMSNPICKNLIKVYGTIELPTIEEILIEGKRLVKEKATTKKGKIITFLNKHKKDYFKDSDKRSFVEESIEIFEYLTDNGLMVPRIGSDKSGGRVYDSFTLMPSWIRKMVKMNGKRIVEADYSALHPNIAMSLYGGEKEYLTHKKIAEELKIEEGEAKIEHLSFFNKTEKDMYKSNLINYYTKHELKMIRNILEEKRTSEFEHKITSMRMFKKEVDIMTNVIEELNKSGIYVIYVYDALMCLEQDKEEVLNKMNNIILNHNVKTKAK